MRTHLVFPFLILSLFFILVYHQPSQYKGRMVYGFKLALQWPNSYCNGDRHCNLPIPQLFKIHGFWPMDGYGHVMTNGDQPGEDSLKQEDVADIKKELDEMWPDLRARRSNFDFWAYEWGKHGVGFRFTPRSYFELAIRCKRKLDDIIGGDLVDYLSGIGFGPNATTDYANQQFPKKIKGKTNFIVAIKCNTADRKSQLLEIYICFKATGDFDNCNFNNTGKGYYYAIDCKRRIIFPIRKEPHDEV